MVMKIGEVNALTASALLRLLVQEGTPFDNGNFNITVKFGENYPFEAPEFRLNPDQCYHPNVGLDGKICLAMLKDGWEGGTKMVTVFEAIRGLFIAPDGEHGEFRPEVAQHFNEDYDTWAVQVIHRGLLLPYATGGEKHCLGRRGKLRRQTHNEIG